VKVPDLTRMRHPTFVKCPSHRLSVFFFARDEKQATSDKEAKIDSGRGEHACRHA